jgi:hypothetical protein
MVEPSFCCFQLEPSAPATVSIPSSITCHGRVRCLLPRYPAMAGWVSFLDTLPWARVEDPLRYPAIGLAGRLGEKTEMNPFIWWSCRLPLTEEAEEEENSYK